MKRKTTRAKKREMKKAAKLAGINKPAGQSKYALKGSKRDRERGWSARPTSPFFLPESQRDGATT